MTPNLSFSQLDRLLEQFDGKHTDILDRVADDFPANPSLLSHLVSMAECADSPVQTAATAVLKRYSTAGAVFTSTLVVRLLDLLSTVTHWESRLHLLQMLPALPIPSSHAESLCESLHGSLRDRNKFVRAWAYGGLHRLASLHPAYRTEVATLLEEAGHKETASARARLRQLPPFEQL